MEETAKTTNQEIYKFYTVYKKWSKLLEKKQKKASERFLCSKAMGSSKHMGRIWECIYEPIHIVLLVFDIINIAIIGEILKRKKRKKLSSIPGCKPANLAMDINELLGRGAQTVYYGDSFTYSALIKKEYLYNIKLIFGDVHLEALDDICYLKNLESVWGDIYFPECANLEHSNLKIVKGDVHGEWLKNDKALKSLKFVGGKIYYKKKVFSSLQAFRRSGLRFQSHS